MERSFAKEIELLKLGQGETFNGEGILAVTKALLQSGVAYVGGYQGAPVSHLLDVLIQAKDLMNELGINAEANSSEASAAAMLAASVNYPVRGAVTWKSVVGTNVASDALSNLSSTGVLGGALIISGEDYGEGASIIQERTHAYALKSTIMLVDPRPDLSTIVNMVEKSFELSEASSSPVMMELRIRACHVQGSFEAKDNVASPINARNKADDPASFLYDRLAHPPVTFKHEKQKVEDRIPAAQKFILENGMNELFDGEISSHGIIVQGGLYNTLIRRLTNLGLADSFGNTRLPILVLNVTHPLVPEQISSFCAGKQSVLVVEEGNPEYLEQQIGQILRRADLQTNLHGKDVLPLAGEYTADVITQGLVDYLGQYDDAGIQGEALRDEAARLENVRANAHAALEEKVPPRPPGFCTGCPERPVFSAIKLLKEELGDIHIAADIGCHAFGTFEPFSMGNSILGYGMSLASAAGVRNIQKKRTISIMGDGGFWHNGLQSGVLSALFNEGDAILIIMQNGYSSATGQQNIPSSRNRTNNRAITGEIERTLKSLGVEWLKTIRTYSVDVMVDTLRDAMTTDFNGLKVIIADGECMLARQRRLKADNTRKLEGGIRVETPRFGIDDEVCTGDHSCIRLSGCPSLTIKPNPDPLRTDPIAHVNNGCVGCGLCGEVSHAAILCPSFYKAERVQNAGLLEKTVHKIRQSVIGLMSNGGDTA
ncbi:MAG: indolepyruvate ferredoxin oxidoreductase [Rhodospirillaceae bacterium TMED167]|nr:indolepyruvate ferredoxin oxidoreductase [Rhodospirillaceae bacterium]OUW25935.1 MAG: indolepyruvate ferredoxin oxidoreductase [Rhodospirillaceae bacterium TMED167]